MEVKAEVAERGDQPGGMETLSKVNEQKDNVLAPNTTLSLSETLARGITERVRQRCSTYGPPARVGPQWKARWYTTYSFTHSDDN